EEYSAAPKCPILVILDNVRSLLNVGAVFRTADALRLRGIVLCGITGRPGHADMHKSALGAEETVDWSYCSDTLEAVRQAREEGYLILSVEQAHDSILLPDAAQVIDTDRPTALILGHEVHGVQQAVVDASDHCIEIPQYGTKHSLNVSVAAGIVLYTISQLYR
uniref:RNA methyltransferase n=1 Tax=uncultured Porphyromonas sp. TaxID=159274 RepID=UPI0025D4BA2B